MVGRGGVLVSETQRARHNDPGRNEPLPMPPEKDRNPQAREMSIVSLAYTGAPLLPLSVFHPTSCTARIPTQGPHTTHASFPAPGDKRHPDLHRGMGQDPTYRERAHWPLTYPSYPLYPKEVSPLSVLLSFPPQTGR